MSSLHIDWSDYALLICILILPILLACLLYRTIIQTDKEEELFARKRSREQSGHREYDYGYGY